MSARPELPNCPVELPELRLPDQVDGLAVRDERADDTAFLEALYAGSRHAEMAMVDWPEPRRQAFLSQQFQAQHSHYRKHYPQARFLIVLHHEQAIGRLYLSPGREELRLMDIVLLPAFQRRGLGRVLMHSVIEMAMQERVAITLHVESYNPARFWYERLGFEVVEERGVYLFMRLAPDALAGAQEKLIS
jgi:GNAT superfamily N-acetyltransferase